jgi:hypothetical protein
MLRVLAVFLIFQVCASANAQSFLSREEIAKIVENHFGPDVEVVVDGTSSLPRYLRGDFNGDGSNDLVVPLIVDRARGTLDAKGITAALLEGETSADKAIGSYCLALGIFHGDGRRGAEKRTSHVFMLYQCFSGYTKVSAQATLIHRSKVNAVGDTLLLDLESGGQMLVYWHGENYHGHYVRLGD